MKSLFNSLFAALFINLFFISPFASMILPLGSPSWMVFLTITTLLTGIGLTFRPQFSGSTAC